MGVTSIGWALISSSTVGEKSIIGMGSRIIPLSVNDKDEFSKGNAISKNQQRTIRRTQRKGYFRYKLRRASLKKFLEKHGMWFPDELMHTSSEVLFSLRARAITEQVSLPELGRILYHLNQKRGYKSSRSAANLDKKDTDYITEVKNRYQQLRDSNQTVGQYFHQALLSNRLYRIKQQVFPREAYVEEFDAIIAEQHKYYPELLANAKVVELRNEIIYYQRRLKSQKGLVSICEFEGLQRKDKNGKDIFSGPRVAPRSSPLFQTAKLLESINSIILRNKRGETFVPTPEQRLALFTYLNDNKILPETEMFKILSLSKADGWYGNKHTAKGIQGNITRHAIKEHLKNRPELLQFDLSLHNLGGTVHLVDKETGEVKDVQPQKVISPTFEQQPLYRLWHMIYSIQDFDECRNALQRTFNLDTETANNLCRLDFTKFGFGNKSAKAIRKIIPYLQDGYVYSDACICAGYNHSRSLTTDERLQRSLAPKLELLKKNSLRQPVVEKILNQLINLVNALIDKYGAPDEIRIELARELKQSKEERNETFIALTKREKETKAIVARIENEYASMGVRATRNTITKWRLFHEIHDHETKINATCVYCGQPFGITDALMGNSIDIEHIIPKSLLFDDSQSNKTLVHRKCNADKGNNTAYDFMNGKGSDALTKYIENIDHLYKNNLIKKSKRDKLLMPSTKIPKDFIERQLRETQYIARKARLILEDICPNVWSTSGAVTSYLRKIWGWGDVLTNLQLPKYREFGLTELQTRQTNNGQMHQQEQITGWSKRDDHRHHAIDALTIACTEQGYIQRINTLSASKTRDDMAKQFEVDIKLYDRRKSLLENYIYSRRPFTTNEIEEVVKKILISFKPGKRVATVSKYKATGKNKITGVLVPRGPLSEESVYGKIRTTEDKKNVKYLFEHPHLIFQPYIKALVIERLALFNNNAMLAIKSLKTDPIYLDSGKTKLLEYGTCFKEEYVIKYPLSKIKPKDIKYIVDPKVRAIVKNRFDKFVDNENEAFKTPLLFNENLKIPIKSIRCLTGLSAVVPIKKDESGREIGFVKPGNNHHIAFYIDEKGKRQEHLCSFWDAVERKKHGFPVVIKNPQAAWDIVLNEQERFTDSFLSKLPPDNWNFVESLQQNEAFLLGLSKEEAEAAIVDQNMELLSKHLYLAWSISEKDYWFRHHLETKNSELKDTVGAKESKRFYRCKSIGAFDDLSPLKVKINILGELTI